MWECRICGSNGYTEEYEYFVCDGCSAVFGSARKWDDTLRIKVKYHDPEDFSAEPVNRLTKIDVGDWIDLSSRDKVALVAGQRMLINLGVSMKMPDGYEGHMLPRSSTFKNYGIIVANSMGIIDNTYCGNNDVWKLSVYATRNVVIPAGSRICQFKVVRKQANKIVFETVDDMESEDRGGLGSTGR